VCKENKNNDFIQQFFSFCVTILRHNREYHDSCVCILLFVNKLQCMLVRWKAACSTGSENSWISSKKKNVVWSEDEQRSYMFGMTWGRVINDRIFIFGWTNLLTSFTRKHARTHARTHTHTHTYLSSQSVLHGSEITAGLGEPWHRWSDTTTRSDSRLHKIFLLRSPDAHNIQHKTYTSSNTCSWSRQRKKKKSSSLHSPNFQETLNWMTQPALNVWFKFTEF